PLRQHSRGGAVCVSDPSGTGQLSRRRAPRAHGGQRDRMRWRRARAQRVRPCARVQVASRSAPELRAGDGDRDADRRSAPHTGLTAAVSATATEPPERDTGAAAFDTSTVLAHLTHKPGVYRMLDARGEVVYVGKARDLKR